MQIRQDDVVNAVRCQLGIPVDGNTLYYGAIWEQLATSNEPGVREVLVRSARFLDKVVRYKLGLSGTVPAHEASQYDALWQLVVNWLSEHPIKRSPLISGMIKDAIANDAPGQAAPPARRPSAPPAPPRGPSTPAPQRPPAQPQGPAAPRAQPASQSRHPAPAPVPPPLPAPPVVPVADAPAQETAVANPPSRVTGPQWKYVAVPDAEPDKHDEYATVSLTNTTDGSQIIGARVRGKKHKHEGTNCDDWFEVRTNKHWSLIAVSDGAGSRKYSRVGAKASCFAAVETMAEFFKYQPPNQPAPGTAPNTLETIRDFYLDQLCKAVQAAYKGVEAEYAQRKDKPEYEIDAPPKKRPLDFADLSATLVLAAHALIKIGDKEHSLVFASQVGDGAVAAVDCDGHVHVLGVAEGGDYSGETDFLTSKKHQSEEEIRKKLYHLSPTPIRALLVMTDGVADDYFPAEPGMARLYADLALNGVLTLNTPAAAVDLNAADLDVDGEAQTPGGPQPLKLRSAEKLAATLGKTPSELVASPQILAAAAKDAGLLTVAATPEERLKWWLDAYTVRGSFDDRTLVVLQPQKDT